MSRNKKNNHVVSLEEHQDYIFEMIEKLARTVDCEATGLTISGETYRKLRKSGYIQSTASINFASGNISYMGLSLVVTELVPEFSLILSGR